LWSALADAERSPDQAKILNNFQMWKKRYIWTTHGIGYVNDNVTAINGGGAIKDFGIFYDTSNNINLLVQSADKLYRYDTVGHAVGAAILSGLSTTAYPTMRPFGASTLTLLPVTVYCNGNANPQLITSTTTAQAMSWTDGFSREYVTIGGTMTPNNKLALTFQSGQLGITPVTVTYTIQANDTVQTAAVGLAAAINASNLSTGGVSATATGTVVTVKYPSGITITFSAGLTTETATIAGTIASGNALSITATIPNSQETATVGGTIAAGQTYSITVTGNGLSAAQAVPTYTTVTGDNTTTTASGITTAINANTVLAAAGISATSSGAVVTISYPSGLTLSFTASATSPGSLVMAPGTPGTAVTVPYTCVTGDNATSVATNFTNLINSQAALAYAGVTATSSAGVITITYPSGLNVVFSKTVSGSVTITLAAGASPTTGALTLLAGSATQAWPVVFDGKTYQKPAFCEPFGDRMVYAGFPDPSTMYDVLISQQGTYDTFTQSAPLLATDANTFTVIGANGPITGLKAFRPSNTNIGQIFLIGQADGVSMITGTDMTNYSLDPLTTMYGIVNNRCWAQVLDDLVFLTNKGVYSFSSLIQNETNPQDALSYPISDQIQQIDFASAANTAFCVHHPITQEIHFYVPFIVDTGTNQHGLILSYNTDGGLAGPVWSTKSGFSIAAGIDYRNQMYGGDYTGFVQSHYNGDTYNGNTVLFHYLSALMTGGNLMQAGRMQNVTVVTDGAKQQAAINVYAYGKFADGSTRKTLCTPSYHIIGDNAVGTTVLPFALGTSSFPNDTVKTHIYRPIGRGIMFELELTNSNIAGDGLDYSRADFTLSIGGMVRH